MSSNYQCMQILDDLDSNEEVAIISLLINRHRRATSHQNVCRNLVPGHTYIWQDRFQGHERLYNDYFAKNPVYPSNIFRRRFRISWPLFFRIQSAVEAYDPYFIRKQNSAKHWGLSSLQKVIAALQMLAYGAVVDSIDDYVGIGESTAIETSKKFIKPVVELFGDTYLRSPNETNIARLLEIDNRIGFPRMLGNIDCMYWKWRNYPTTWKCMYSGCYHEPTIILEAVASHDLWIWHAFFGLPGSLNDINVLERSSLFKELTEGKALMSITQLMGITIQWGIIFVNGIYPSQLTFVKTILAPQGNKRKHFTACQESARKDVEYAFGLFQAQFAIVRGPAQSCDPKTLNSIMKACIILYNMIIEDERNIDNSNFNYGSTGDSSHTTVLHEHIVELSDFIQPHYNICD